MPVCFMPRATKRSRCWKTSRGAQSSLFRWGRQAGAAAYASPQRSFISNIRRRGVHPKAIAGGLYESVAREAARRSTTTPRIRGCRATSPRSALGLSDSVGTLASIRFRRRRGSCERMAWISGAAHILLAEAAGRLPRRGIPYCRDEGPWPAGRSALFVRRQYVASTL